MTEEVTADEIIQAALKVFTREELQQLSRPVLLTIGTMIGKRLADKSQPYPTIDELEGIRELATEHLWHVAFDMLSPSNGGAQ